jgi:hypothetical protein
MFVEIVDETYFMKIFNYADVYCFERGKLYALYMHIAQKKKFALKIT